jgi:glutamate carboxypeptidase
VGDFVVEIAKKHGWQVEIHEERVSGNAIAITMNQGASGAPFAISAHMDTVHPVGSFGSPAVKIEGDKIYGPGVTDCKGGIVAAFCAMDALRLCGFKSRPVRLFLQSDEEGGGKQSKDATINYICERSVDSVAFLNLEGSSYGKACLIRKGIATFIFTVKGKEAHASACAKLGANAILDAAYKIIELEKIKDNDGLTCCCAVINGGTTHNTVPGLCEFKANVRFATNEQLEWMKKYAEELASTVHVPGCTCSVVLPRVRPAMEYSEKNVALLDNLNKIWVENGFDALEMTKNNGGSDAANASSYGIPTIDNLGTVGGLIHSPNEYGVVSSLAEFSKRLALAAWYI